MKKGWRIFFGILLVLYLAAVAYICFHSFKSLPRIRTIWGFPADKFVHFVMFLPFPFLMYLTFAPITKHFFKALMHILIIFGIGCSIAAGTEVIQTHLKYRTGDLMDFKADATALAISSVLTLLLNYFLVAIKSRKKT
jgi:VanZ family protein